MRHNKRLLAVTLLWGVLIHGSAAGAEDPLDILIIANRGNAETSLSVNEVHPFFLKLRTSWSSGRAIVPVHQPPGSPARIDFLQRVLKLTEAEEKRYWEEQKVQRGLTAPPMFSNVSRAVFKIAGSVSYVYRRDYQEGVCKILLVVPAPSLGQSSSPWLRATAARSVW